MRLVIKIAAKLISGGMALINKIENVIERIYARPNAPDCLFIDINKLTDIDALMKKVS
jgi:hypothetical protein